MILRNGTEDDLTFYYDLKCEPTAIFWGGFSHKPDFEGLKDHYNKLISGAISGKDLYILEDNDLPVGYLQLTHNNDKEIEIGYG